jgi:FimV-like protein
VFDRDLLAAGLQVTGSRRPVSAAAATAAVVALGTAVALQMARDATYPRAAQLAQTVLYIQSGPALQRIALAFDALVADVYWIRALQHYGGEKLDPQISRPKFQALHPLLDITTSLDPYFTIAYRFGAIFLSEPYPNGPGRPDQAVALLQKGLRVEPTKWQYYHDIAFVYYWTMRDMTAAADWFRRAAAQPDAPSWLDPLAATILIEGGDRASARFLLQQILASEEAWLRQMATRALQQVDALDAIDQLQALAVRHPPPAGEPYSWRHLVRRVGLRGIPTDPTGVPFAIDPGTGVVSVSRTSTLHPMPGVRTPSPPVR